MSTSTSRIMFYTIPCDGSAASGLHYRQARTKQPSEIISFDQQQDNSMPTVLYTGALVVSLRWIVSARWNAKVLIDLNYSWAGEGFIYVVGEEKARAWNSNKAAHTKQLLIRNWEN